LIFIFYITTERKIFIREICGLKFVDYFDCKDKLLSTSQIFFLLLSSEIFLIIKYIFGVYMSKANILFILIYCLTGTVSQAQMPISDADAKQLGYKKVVKYLEKNESRNQVHFFSEIQPSVNDSNDLKSFYFHCGTYTIHAPVGQVWNTCMTTSPSSLWKGKMLGLSCVYSNNSDKMFYRGDQQFETLGLHQIYFINLRMMRLFNMAAALITTKIDDNEKIMEFTYIKGNKSTGKQTVRLVETNERETKIVHETFYRSGSKFRDKRLYPRFHQIAITNLHQKIEAYSTLSDN